MLKLAAPLLLLSILLPVAGCGTLAATGSHGETTRYGFDDHNASPSDAAIVADIRRQLIKDTSIPAQDIEVTSQQGVVILQGRVHSSAIEKRITDICRQIQGVNRVESHLSIAVP
jgi:osmotically-inducible protein OsmY